MNPVDPSTAAEAIVEPEPGQTWSRDGSHRLISEANVVWPHVVYALYRDRRGYKGKTHAQYVRAGYCSIETFRKWARRATLQGASLRGAETTTTEEAIRAGGAAGTADQGAERKEGTPKP